MSNKKLKEIVKKHFTIYHIIGILLGIGLALTYWHLSGKNCEQLIKNNPFLVSIWGMLVGYITFDFVKNAIQSKKKDL